MQLVGPSSLILTQAEKAIALYDPRSISGLALWLDANSLNSTLNSGDRVQNWTDRSSYGHIAYQNTEANKPYFYKNKWNGNSVVRALSSGSHYMRINRHSSWEGNNITIIYAIVSLGGSSAAKLLSRSYTTGAWATPFASWCFGVSYSNYERPDSSFTVGAALSKIGYIDSIIIGDNVIGSVKYDGTASYIHKINGVSRTVTYAAGATATGNLDYTNQTDLSLFTRSVYSLGEYSNVSVGDILIYNLALSDADLTIVENYLKYKYGTYFHIGMS